MSTLIRFSYEVDDLVFELPWAKPDIYRLKMWYLALMRGYESASQFDFTLFGDFWSSGKDDAWDATVFVSRPLESPDWDSHATLTMAHQVLVSGFKLAVDEFRLMVRISYTLPGGVHRLFEHLRQAETTRSLPANCREALPPRYEPFLRYRKVKNGIVEFERAVEIEGAVELGEGLTMYRRKPILERQLLNQVISGRVYYPPLSLRALFMTNDALIA